MSASNQLAVWLPIVLGALLIGFAVGGSHLSASMRVKIQRFVLLPLLALGFVASIWLAIAQHDYGRAGFVLVMMGLTIPRLFPRATPASPGHAQ